VREKVLVDAQACEDVSAAENQNVPAELAENTAMWERVSEVPPFVHGPMLAAIANADPPDDDVQLPVVTCRRVVEPTDTAVVPAAPGSAVCNSTHVAVGAVYAVPLIVFSQPVATFAAEIPTTIGHSPLSSCCLMAAACSSVTITVVSIGTSFSRLPSASRTSPDALIFNSYSWPSGALIRASSLAASYDNVPPVVTVSPNLAQFVEDGGAATVVGHLNLAFVLPDPFAADVTPVQHGDDHADDHGQDRGPGHDSG
jgi:hypothetical protein